MTPGMTPSDKTTITQKTAILDNFIDISFSIFFQIFSCKAISYRQTQTQHSARAAATQRESLLFVLT
jgi:hypothetical protein